MSTTFPGLDEKPRYPSLIVSMPVSGLRVCVADEEEIPVSTDEG
jgi:hypothetical protein